MKEHKIFHRMDNGLFLPGVIFLTDLEAVIFIFLSDQNRVGVSLKIWGQMSIPNFGSQLRHFS